MDRGTAGSRRTAKTPCPRRPRWSAARADDAARALSRDGAMERQMKAAAFFDLDHTLISRATPIALANSFRRRRLIRRRDLIRAAAWHVIFLLRGLEEEAVRKG